MCFSIVTITRNNLAGLQKTRASVDAQTCRDFEWIIIDGASTDGSAEVLERCEAMVASEPDNGIYDAMNKGIARASGEYLLFLNAGDTLAAPETLSKLLPAISTKPAFIYGDALEETSSGPAYKSARSHRGIARGMFTHHQAMLYARDRVGDLRYDETYQISADYDFTARFLQNYMSSAAYIRMPICVFECGGLSQQRTAQGRREQFEIRKNLGLCSAPANHIITGAQSLTQALRSIAPNLYWKLRH